MLSLVIPTYNERENIPILVERVHQVLSNYKYEMIIVDDDSPDGTGEIAEELAKEYPLRVIHRKNERGLASAVVAGFKKARGEILAVMDADLQHPPKKIPELLKEIENGADIAVASRYAPGGSVGEWNLKRKIISRVATLLAKFVISSARKASDPMSGFFMLKRKVIEGVDLKPKGYKILLEVLAVGNHNSVVNVPFIFGEREMGESNLNAKEQIDYLKHLLSLGIRKGEFVRLLKYILVGISGVFVNQGALKLLVMAGLFPMVGSVFAIQAAILSNFTWNHIWTFRDRRKEKTKLISRLGKFELVSVGGKCANILILYLTTYVFGVSSSINNLIHSHWESPFCLIDEPYLIGNLIGIAAGFIINFILNNIWTWKR
jgi:dolichol-phosphate mannosyltransferase